jgi:hypothetical protein
MRFKEQTMSDPFREPRPLSPERLSLLSIDGVRHKDYMIEMQATFMFNPWEPDWPDELSRAVTVLNNVINDSAEYARAKRERLGAEQYKDLTIPTSIQGESPEPKFKVGDRVRNDMFIGTVTSIEEYDDQEDEFWVAWDEGGQSQCDFRTLALHITSIERCDPPEVK